MVRIVGRASIGLILLLSLSLCLSSVSLSAVAEENSYADGENIVLWANKVGPYHNPSESYPFYSVPGCPPLTDHPLESQPESFGALLEADTLTDTGIRFRFKQEQQAQKVCQFKITERESYEQLLYMVRNHYWYHMVLDELPIFGMSGEFITEEEMKVELAELAAAAAGVAGGVDVKTPSSSDILTGSTTPGAQGFIYTHKDFSISYNGRQIIEVNLTSENPRPIVMGETYPMTYSVTWISTEQSFETRFNRYLDFDFFEHQIHWFSIMNSFMLVVFLCGLVLLILSRTIKTSINSGFSDPESPTMSTISNNAGDEIGFKLLVGDVFRAPNHLLLYSVLLGTGVQLFLLISAALVLALAVTYYDESRGLLISAFLIFYSLTSGVQGYITGWHYKLHGGISWKRAMWLGVFMYPAILLTLLCLLNTIAITFGSHGLLSIPTTLMLTLIWACVSVPLTIAGTILARQHTQPGAFPCRVNAIRRLIPSENVGNASLPNNPNSSANQWYTNYWLLIVMSGILPFGSVFIEIYFVFTSFWNYKYYFVYGFMTLVFIIFLIVTICVAIVSTYVLLNAEDYRWHWLAFLTSASSAGYIFLYSLYYFYAKTHMAGIVQTTYYFSYVTLICLTVGVITGAIGALGTRIFITKIYSYTKAD